MLNRDFKEFAALLNSAQVEYLVVGGYALAAHGHPRYTGDLDIWLHRDAPNITKVLEVLEQFGFGGLGLTAEDFLKPGAVIQLGYPPARIDLLTDIDGVEFRACQPRRVNVSWDGVELPFIGLDDFRANKRAAGRNKDLADLESLEDPPNAKPPVG
jgi:hypothetical protein